MSVFATAPAPAPAAALPIHPSRQPTSPLLDFLPHPRVPAGRRPSLSPKISPVVGPLTAATGASGSRSRSGTISATPASGSRSAPTSPSGRGAHSGMLAPLSQITPIQLDERARVGVQAYQGGMSNFEPALGLYGHGQAGGYLNGQMGSGPSGGRAAYQPISSQPLLSSNANAQAGPSRQPTISRSSQQQAGYRAVSNGHTPSSRPLAQSTSLPMGQGSTSSRPAQASSRSRSRSRHLAQPPPPPSSSSSSSSGTETEVDSDSTFVPGRLSTSRRQTSLSQPNLMAMRNRLEGWAGDVARENVDLQGPAPAERRPGPVRQHSYGSSSGQSAAATPLGGIAQQGRKTPPNRPAALQMAANGFPASSSSMPHASTAPLPSRSPSSRSYPSLHGQQGRKSPSHSPRAGNSSIPSMTPVISRAGLPRSASTSPDTPLRPLGGITSSEDGDDDYDGTTDSLSSDSLSFSPKRRRRSMGGGISGSSGLRNRFQPDRVKGSLGLSFDQADTSDTEQGGTAGRQGALDLSKITDQHSTLFHLRLLALWPAMLGSVLLFRAILGGGLWYGSYPFGLDLSKEALDSVISGRQFEGVWLEAHRGDLLLCLPWAALTGQLCFDLTTGLTHRWRLYYDKLAAVTRLLSIQCICQPLTFLTLWTLGPSQILFAWVVIGCTTAASRAVQMYVTSNIVRPGRLGSTGTGVGGDVTPNASGRRRSLPGSGMVNGRANGSGGNKGSRSSSEDADTGKKGDGAEADITGLTGMRKAWAEFREDRKWDWDALAREVGWKLGTLLLLTNAWLFWGIHGGRWVEVR